MTVAEASNTPARGGPGHGEPRSDRLAGSGTTADGALEDPAATAEVLASTEPAVDSVVITGPTQAVAAAVERYAPDQTDLLELDFDRSAPQVCW